MIVNWDPFSVYSMQFTDSVTPAASCSRYFFFFFLAVPHGMWALSPLTRNQTPCPLHWKHGGS